MIHPPALVELHRRAAAGVTSAQLELGMRYVTGNGIPPDAPTALRWIGKAAAQVNPTAQFELGSYDTLAPRRNNGRAADGLRRSALQGFASPDPPGNAVSRWRVWPRTGSRPAPGCCWS